MIIPRVKREMKRSSVCRLAIPVLVKLDAGSAFAADVISEMLPYLAIDYMDGSDAAITISICPSVSDKPEFYKLTSSDGKVSIVARDQRGVVNALATLTQLIMEENGIYFIAETEIEDYPDKEFRSFMIDTGRKYIPLDELRAQILMMAKAKMTKLHWHITDSQGCPVLFDTLPDIKSPDPDGRKYTKKELCDIVEYAAKFRIDIIPEIDMPGHSFTLISHMPDLGCKAEPREGWDLCIGSEACYKFIENILGELAEIFPYEYIHIGTDEIDMRDVKSKRGRQIQDWDRCPVCNEKFGKLGLETVTDRFYYFVNRVYEILQKLGKKMAMWNDNIDISKSPDIPHDIMIEFWRVAGENRGPREGCSMQRFLEDGFTVINAHYPSTYIDLPEYLSWNKLRAWNLTVSPAQAGVYANQIIGGETCAWDVQRHYAFSLYTTVPAFADKVYNLVPVTDDTAFGIALTKLALGPSVPKDYNMFEDVLCDFILGFNQCNIFKEGADKGSFKNMLTSLKATSSDQKTLISAYLELL